MTILNRNFQNEAAQIRTAFNQERDRINQNSRLNEHGKQSSIQELADAANLKIQQIRDDYQQWKTERQAQLEQSLFGLGHKEWATEADKQAKITGYRAALDSAGQTKTKGELEQKLAQANTFGDDLMRKAVAYHADARGEEELAKAALNHLYDDELTELGKLRDQSVQQKFAEGTALGGVTG